MTSSRPRRSLAGIQPRCPLLQREWSASDFQSDSQKRACKAVAHLLPCNEIPFAWLAATDASSDMHCHLALSRALCCKLWQSLLPAGMQAARVGQVSRRLDGKCAATPSLVAWRSCARNCLLSLCSPLCAGPGSGPSGQICHLVWPSADVAAAAF